jgi:hypothetical protein
MPIPALLLLQVGGRNVFLGVTAAVPDRAYGYSFDIRGYNALAMRVMIVICMRESAALHAKKQGGSGNKR